MEQVDYIWEKIFSSCEFGKYPGEELIRFVARNFYRAPDRKEIKLLEMGCGPGANLWYMAREGFSVYGVDLSSVAVKRARNRLDLECPMWSGDVINGDIEKIPFPDEFFDAVIDNEAIYVNSFDKSRRIYAEMFRVVKRGGKLFSRTFATGCYGDGTGKKLGHNLWIVADGPMVGTGSCRFTDYKDIELLIGKFKAVNIELLTTTVNSRKNEVREWIILGERV